MSAFRLVCIVSACLSAIACVSAPAVAVTLVRDGEATSVIVTGNHPTVVQQVAAEQLQYHLKRMTGAEVPIIAEQDLDSTDATRIYVGPSEALKSLGIDTTKLAPETLIVRTIEGALVLAGDDTGSDKHDTFYTAGLDPDIPPDPGSQSTIGGSNIPLCAGTLYAVYDFLQDELGCRWLWPGPAGEVIPKRQTVEVGHLDVQETPVLFRRHMRPGYVGWTRDRVDRHVPLYMQVKGEETFASLDLAEWHWLARMKMGASDQPEYGHAFTEWYELYHDDRPELFALQPDGTRGLANPMYPKAFVKMCVSNDAVVDLIVERFLERRKNEPGLRWLNACENDGSLGYCVCDDCKALDVTADDERVQSVLKERGWTDEQIERQFSLKSSGIPNALSNRYFDFNNRVARRLAEVAPDAMVVTYAYAKYQFAPIDMQIEPNMLVGLIGFNYYPMTAEEQAQEVSNVQAWKDAGVQQMFFRPNSMIFSPAWGIPWDESVDMGDDLHMLIRNGMVATDFDRLMGLWPTSGPMYYVLSRMHWDHEKTASQLREEFMQAFGPAAEPVEAYFDHWRDVFREVYDRPDIDEVIHKADPLGGRLGRRKAVAFLLTEEHFARGRELLAEARQRITAEGDNDLLQPLHVLELGQRHGELMVEGAKFAIAREYDKPRRYDTFWPTELEIHRVREELAELDALNIFAMLAWEFQIHDPYAIRVYYDFAGRPYEPITTPARKDWLFAPDPDDQGESDGWFRDTLDDQLTLHPVEHPSYRHLFYSPWEYYGPVSAWTIESDRDAVINGWYQHEFAISAADLDAGGVLYVPYVLGSAKVWINDTLVREVSAADGRSNDAIVIDPSEAGIEADKPFRLTIKVHSTEPPSGLIGPVYVAKRSAP